MLTHAFNAMPGIHHRAPGPVTAAALDNRVIIELILDGHHVDPSVAALLFAATPGRIAIVTDAMAGAGLPDGEFTLGTLDVTVSGGIARLRGTETIAGSTATQDVSLRLAIEEAHIAPATAIEALTLTPARALGMDLHHGLLAPGFTCDAVRLTPEWSVLDVWADGHHVA
jgi:N-acetylglucosamine-6-phosphate deacetylase